MEIFNVGPLELVLILLIMLIVLGPEQSVTHMKNLARFIRRLVKSPLWADIMSTSREIKDLPQKMLRDTGLDEDMAEMNRQINPSIARPAASRPADAGRLNKSGEEPIQAGAEKGQSGPKIEPPAQS